MVNSIEIGKAIYAVLSEDEKVKGIVGKKIYPLIAPVNTTYPFCVYSRESINPSYCKDGNHEDSVNVTIISCSNDYTESAELANAIREALELKHGSINNLVIKQIRITNITESFVDDAYLQRIYFNIITE
mgnify:CR=1 FL=1